MLTGFLNAVLDSQGDKAIVSIEYLDEGMPAGDPTSSLGYHFKVDLRCRTKEGMHFLIEMHQDLRDDYHMKSLLEHFRMLSRLDIEQTLEDKNGLSEQNKNDANKSWKSIQGVFTIALVDTNNGFDYSKRKNSYPVELLMEPLLRNTYELRHIQQLDRHYGNISNQIILLMFDNLSETVSESSSTLERWAHLFKTSSLTSDVQPRPVTKLIENADIIIGNDDAIREFIDRIDMEYLPDSIRNRYLSDVKYYNDSIFDILEKSREKGEKRYREEGEKRYREESEKRYREESEKRGREEGEKKARAEEREKIIRLLSQQGHMDSIRALYPDVTEDELAKYIVVQNP